MCFAAAAFSRTCRLLFVFSVCATLDAFSQSLEVDIAALTRGASDVVVGTITDVTSRMGTNVDGDHLIFSDLAVDVSDTLKGELRGSITITVEGGDVGGLVLSVSDMPTLRRGDRALFFLNKNARGEWALYGHGGGVMKIDAAGRLGNGPHTLDSARTQIRSAR